MYDIFEQLVAKNGISVYRVSKDTGIATATFSDWKNGRSAPKADKLQIIADYFGVTVDYLLTGEKKPLVNDDEELNEYLEELKNRKEMRMLFSLAKGATKEDVERAVAIIEALHKRGD